MHSYVHVLAAYRAMVESSRETTLFEIDLVLRESAAAVSRRASYNVTTVGHTSYINLCPLKALGFITDIFRFYYKYLTT